MLVLTFRVCVMIVFRVREDFGLLGSHCAQSARAVGTAAQVSRNPCNYNCSDARACGADQRRVDDDSEAVSLAGNSSYPLPDGTELSVFISCCTQSSETCKAQKRMPHNQLVRLLLAYIGRLEVC